MVNREKSGSTTETVKPGTNKLTAITFDTFLAEVIEVARTHERVVLDLTDVQFMDVFAMVGVIYCCEDIQGLHGCRIRLEFTDDGAGGFLPRIGFFDVLGPAVEYPEVFTPARLEWERALHGEDKRLLELTPIDSPAAIDAVQDKLIHVLHYQLKYRLHDAYDLAIVFSELCNNVLDHSPADALGLAAMRIYGTQGQRFMQFVVADRGDGIKTTLTRNPNFANIRSDNDAIITSTDLGASEHEENTRGNGLYHLLKLAFKHQGNVRIRSGRGNVYWRMDLHKRHQFNVPYLQGTQFSIIFPTHA